KFELQPAHFKSINDELKYNIKLPKDNTANDLVSYLTTQGQLNHFVEVIPSANDIFIETVQKN
ncbi:MAG: ABC-2 type transport system ATP-binding protein, partial [Patiriisocius sp.]